MSSQVFSSDVEVFEEDKFLNEIAMEDYLKGHKALLGMGYQDVQVIGFEIPWEKSNKKGRIDLLVDYESFAAIVELKNSELIQEHLDQLISYLEGSGYKENLPSIYKRLEERKVSEWKGILVGTSVNFELLVKIKQDEKLRDMIAVITFRRFKNPEGQYFFVSDVIHSFKPSKDFTKYKIEGDSQEYPKARLILACVEKYLRKDPSVSFAELRKKVVEDVQTTSKINLLPFLLEESCLEDHHYHWAYYKNKPFVSGDNKRFVVFNWLDKSDMEAVKKVATNLGFKIL